MAHIDDPRKVWDFVTGAVIGAGCLFYIVGNLILLKNRDYKPIQARGVTLTILSSLGGLIWVAATIVVLNHFGRPEHSIWAICSLWTFWLQACFGFGLWLNCLTVRMAQLYAVFIWKMRFQKRDLLKLTIAPLFVLLSPTIIVCICASAVHASKYVSGRNEGDCRIKTRVFAIILLCLLPAYFSIFLWFAFALRNIMAQWNEFRQIRIGGIMSFFLLLLSLVTYQTEVYHHVAGRCFLSFAVAGAVFYYFWARNWEVIYNVLFHKEDYFQRFGNELNRFDERSSFHFEADPMERLVRRTKEEARSCQQSLEELQQELSTLVQLHAQLQKEVVGHMLSV